MLLALSVDEQKNQKLRIQEVQEGIKQKVKLRPKRSDERRPRAGKEQGLENPGLESRYLEQLPRNLPLQYQRPQGGRVCTIGQRTHVRCDQISTNVCGIANNWLILSIQYYVPLLRSWFWRTRFWVSSDLPRRGL